MRVGRRSSKTPRRWLHALLLAALLGAGGASAREFPEASHPQPITAEEVLALLISGEGPVVVDTRGRGSYLRDHIPGAINVHSADIFRDTEVLEPYREQGVVLYCGNGKNSNLSAQKLVRAGYRKVYVLLGTLRNWRFSDYPLEVGDPEAGAPE